MYYNIYNTHNNDAPQHKCLGKNRLGINNFSFASSGCRVACDMGHLFPTGHQAPQSTDRSLYFNL